jgi:two-component system, NtrC family, nitrogen regulation response regulator NtrX
VRELRNVIERTLLLTIGDTVDLDAVERALPGDSAIRAGSNGDRRSADGALATRVEAFERETLLAELKRNRHHMTNTAKALGLERSHLYKKCQQLGIDLRAIRSES